MSDQNTLVPGGTNDMTPVAIVMIPEEMQSC